MNFNVEDPNDTFLLFLHLHICAINVKSLAENRKKNNFSEFFMSIAKSR